MGCGGVAKTPSDLAETVARNRQESQQLAALYRNREQAPEVEQYDRGEAGYVEHVTKATQGNADG